MITLAVKVGLSGQQQVATAFNGVKLGVRNRVLKDACRKQAGKGLRVAKTYLSRKRTGQLSRAIAYLYRTYKKGSIWLYVVGPKKGMRVRVSDLTVAGQRQALRKLGKQRGRRLKLNERQMLRFLQSYVDPVKYAHLVEGGRKPVAVRSRKVLAGNGVIYGRRVAGVQPRPFMAPAAASVAGSSSEMVGDVLKGIDREAAKYQAKGKSIKG